MGTVTLTFAIGMDESYLTTLTTTLFSMGTEIGSERNIKGSKVRDSCIVFFWS